MSALADALRDARKVEFLVELDFDGLVNRYAMKDVVVPNSSGDDKFFEGTILQEFEVAIAFDFRSWRYDAPSVDITLANTARLQDQEAKVRLDGGTGRIYLWAPGLTWDDIHPKGLIFCGAFEKKSHDKYSYTFALTDRAEHVFDTIPKKVITEDLWPNARAAGGGGSVLGRPYPMIFGDWPKGVPVHCVSTTAYTYLVCGGTCKSDDDDYTYSRERLYDKNGSAISATYYTFYPDRVDAEGDAVAYFDVTSDHASLEPLSCSIEGIFDASGDITGTAGAVIEHPADIILHLVAHHSSLLPGGREIESLRTMRSCLPGLKFATIIKEQAPTGDIIDRILYQCRCARIPRGEGIGVVPFDTNGPPLRSIIKDFHATDRVVTIEPTPADAVFNRVRASYKINPVTGAYEDALIRDRTNNSACRQSYFQYGERPSRDIAMPDIQNEAAAVCCLERMIEFAAFRHDVATVPVPVWEGVDFREGDVALLTLEEGPSLGGLGWVDEPCILVDRRFTKRNIIQRWWKIAT